MRKAIVLLVLLVVFGLSIIYQDKVVQFVVENVFSQKKETTQLVNNSYAQKNSYNFVQLTDDFEPNNEQDILNIYYTIINSGMSDFTFYCPTSYENCLDDVDRISEDQVLLSNVNNYVSVYNSFQNIETDFDTLGKVDVKITHNYSKQQIDELEQMADKIIQENITSGMTTEVKIKTIHDYIINTTVYDKNRSDNKVKEYHSDLAYGALIEHYAICGGYSDSMKLFLDRLGINNYKVSSENHIWNLVQLDNEWLHLDLTWDDPVTSSGENVLEYDYFLITTDELYELKTDQHYFDKTIYTEAK